MTAWRNSREHDDDPRRHPAGHAAARAVAAAVGADAEPCDRRVPGRAYRAPCVPCPWHQGRHRPAGVERAAGDRADAGGAGGGQGGRDDPRGQHHPVGRGGACLERQRRRAVDADANRRVPDPRHAGPDAASGAGAVVEAERGRQRVDLRAPPRREVPRWPRHGGRRRGRDDGPAVRPEERLQCAVGLPWRAFRGWHAEGRRPDGGVPPRRAERQFPVSGVVGQLQRHHPAGRLLRGLREDLYRHRPVQAGAVHAQRRRQLRAQPGLVGRRRAAGAHRVQLLRRPAAADPGTPGRPGGRDQPGAGAGRAGVAERPRRQADQAALVVAPRGSHQDRRAEIRRQAGAAGHGVDARPARPGRRAVPRRRRARQRVADRAGVSVGRPVGAAAQEGPGPGPQADGRGRGGEGVRGNADAGADAGDAGLRRADPKRGSVDRRQAEPQDRGPEGVLRQRQGGHLGLAGLRDGHDLLRAPRHPERAAGGALAQQRRVECGAFQEPGL